jgi:hypothetical protein
MIDRRSAAQPRLRVAPNMTFFSYGSLGSHLGELAQSLIEAGTDDGIAVEIDTNERLRPGEVRAGAAPLQSVELYLAGVASREAFRLADLLFDSVVAWVKRRREPQQEPVAVTIYGPNGRAMKKVYVDVDGIARDRPE